MAGKGTKRRSASGDGSIYQRESDGRWVAQVTLPDGSRKYLYGKTQAEARAKKTKALHDLDRGIPLTRDERQTLAQYLAVWLDMIRPAIKPKTYRTYEPIIRTHVVPTLGKLPLTRLSPPHVQRLYAQLIAAGLSTTTVHHVHMVLHKALADALRLGLISRNVTAAVTPPRIREHQMRVLSLADVSALLAAADGDRLEALYVVALSTGMRQGELLGLRWQDVDLERGTAQVRQTLYRAGDPPQFGTPKTRTGRRLVKLNRHCIAALYEHRVRQRLEKLKRINVWATELDLIFCNTIGGAIDPTNLLRQQFYPLLARAGLPRVRFHDLRHTAATLLLARRMPTKSVSDMLGHASTQITSNIYSHVTPDIQQDVADTMDAILDEAEADAKRRRTDAER